MNRRPNRPVAEIERTRSKDGALAGLKFGRAGQGAQGRVFHRYEITANHLGMCRNKRLSVSVKRFPTSLRLLPWNNIMITRWAGKAIVPMGEFVTRGTVSPISHMDLETRLANPLLNLIRSLKERA